MSTIKNICIFAGLLITLFVVGCGKSESEDTAQSSTSASSIIPAGLFTMTRPQDVPTLLEVKNSAKAGDTVTFLARVGGRVKPFADGFAIFVVADPTLVSCELMGEEDHCPYPWDYCCEDRDKITKGLATIQIVDSEGIPLRTNLEGTGGLEGSKYLVVEGILNERNDDGVFVVDAESIWVGGKPNRADHAMGSMMTNEMSSAGPPAPPSTHDHGHDHDHDHDHNHDHDHSHDTGVPHDHDGDGIADH